MTSETENTAHHEAKKGSNLLWLRKCEIGEICQVCSELAFFIQSIGFAFILIGVNYLIFKERLLGNVASEVEKYVNEAVWNEFRSD